ncbi:hypothetical protein PsorP6_008450 [Peronosclerospora sorghi]|uniref:Uncharacterized protein n=1 Tax=Peronosclerospora sorghi TaxID=230839 RepID=A0ACC0WDC2_9STRA|nr:hypothetical protein PsorP6_008450 [Peronosclerospora sorghi]
MIACEAAVLIYLQEEFGKYGEINSVKIMWPRSEEERARKRNCGFLSFYERRNADDALINLDNKEMREYHLKQSFAQEIPPSRLRGLGISIGRRRIQFCLRLLLRRIAGRAESHGEVCAKWA